MLSTSILILLGLAIAFVCALLRGKLIKGEAIVITLEKVGLIMFAVGLFLYFSGPALR
jgi:hypothetical protein